MFPAFLLALLACDSASTLPPVGAGPASAARFPSPDEDARVLASDGEAGDRFGVSIAPAGDIDRDGYADFIVGAPGADEDAGAAYVYYGTFTGVDPGREALMRPEDLDADTLYGDQVAAGGDLDGDGYADVAVGARRSIGTRGSVFLYYGGTTGLRLRTETELIASDGTTFDYFGAAVQGAGDLDGDGFDDLAVGAPGDDTQATDAGSVYLYFGTSSGIDASTQTLLQAKEVSAGDQIGTAIASPGDVNNDGYDDLIVGVPGRGSNAGAAYVYLGNATGVDTATQKLLDPATSTGADGFGRSISRAGDIDQDGFQDVVIGAWRYDEAATDSGAAFVYYGNEVGLNPDTEARLSNPAASSGDHMGWGVAGPGDLDGDGFDDVVVSAYGALDGAGSLFVFFGGDADIGTNGTRQISSLAGAAGDGLGIGLSGVGDLDGDGAGDLVAGAPGDDGLGTDAGAALVYLACVDADGDGDCARVDCDDNDETVDATTEYLYLDADGDGYGDPDSGAERCPDTAGTASEGGDCDDTDDDVNPGMLDLPGDAVDANCDGKESCYADLDGDGWSDGRAVATPDLDCTSPGEVDDQHLGDCDDTDDTVLPGALDTCGDGVDQDCDGIGGPDGDEDGDGLSWNLESRLGTSDCDEDSDDDGLTDGEEWELGTDPLLADTDGDGWGDAEDPDPLTPRLDPADIGTSSCATAPASPGLLILGALAGLGLRRRRRA